MAELVHNYIDTWLCVKKGQNTVSVKAMNMVTRLKEHSLAHTQMVVTKTSQPR